MNKCEVMKFCESHHPIMLEEEKHHFEKKLGCHNLDLWQNAEFFKVNTSRSVSHLGNVLMTRENCTLACRLLLLKTDVEKNVKTDYLFVVKDQFTIKNFT